MAIDAAGGIKRGDEERRKGERRKSEEKRRNRERMIEKKRDEKKERERERKGETRAWDRRKSRAGDGAAGRRGRTGVRGRELDVRTNAICMILHVLARPGAAPIGFQLSAYVFCLLFWLRHGRHAGARIGKRGAGGGQRRGAERREREGEKERLPMEVAASTRRERKLFCLVFLDARRCSLTEKGREREKAVGLLTGSFFPGDAKQNKIFSTR